MSVSEGKKTFSYARSNTMYLADNVASCVRQPYILLTEHCMSSDLLLYVLIGVGMVVGNFMAKDSFLYPVL